MARRYRPRKEFKFWLYHDLAEDTRLMEYIQFLVRTRRFATTIRNGLRLMWTLGQGDLSVLFDLFPTLRSQFTPDNTALIEEFRRLLHEQSHVPASSPGLMRLEAGELPSARTFALPVLDDDDDQATLVIKRDTSTTAGDNFLKSILSIQ